MQRVFTISIILCGIFSSLHSEEIIIPETVDSAEITSEPYRFNGLLQVGNVTGSASLVGNGLIATSAHVIFDDDALVWEPVGSISYYPQNHTATFNVSGNAYHPAAFIRWTSYRTRVENDESPPGQSTPDTFNIDYAVGYFSGFVTDEAISQHAEVNVDLEETVGLLRDAKPKMITGYPSEQGSVPVNERGLMHRTAPADYFCWWGGLTNIEQTWRDSEDYWVAVYNFEGVTTYSGNSGGPIYVNDVEGEWTMAGVVVGSNGNDGVLIRAIDENAWGLIEQAAVARGLPSLQRITNLQATATSGTSVDLTWANIAGESGYILYRSDLGKWEQLEILPQNTKTYTDAQVLPGRVYHYRVQPFDANGNRSPKSPEAIVEIPGLDSAIAGTLGAPALRFSSSGDSNWFAGEDDRLRAGVTRSLGNSALALDIIGPGTVSFDWSVSSERNPNYGDPNHPEGEDVFDGLFLYLDGEPVLEAGKPVHLSGLDLSEALAFDVPAGSHRVEWMYSKDPYTTEGADTGYLENIGWSPGPSDPYPVYGAFQYADSEWHGSAWLGSYFVKDFPWVAHTRLGWIYLYPGDGHTLFLYSPIPEFGNMITNPQIYPYFYRIESGDWIYYYTDTGAYGSNVWYYDLASETPVELP